MNNCNCDTKRIVTYGIFYFPAWKHYGRPGANVICNKCGRGNLTSCIGYGEQDLCLLCADAITSNCCVQICPIQHDIFFDERDMIE